MNSLPTEIKIRDVWRCGKPIIVVYKREMFVRNDGMFIIAYTSEHWKECLELVESKESFNENEMLNRLNNHHYYGKKLKDMML